MAWTEFVNGTTADADEVNANFDQSRDVIIAEAGEAIAIGKCCYIKESDGKAYLSDSTTAPFFSGIAYAGVDAAADVTLVTSGLWVTTGLVDKEIYYLGSSGALSTTVSGIRIGSANGTTDLYIDTSRYNQGGSVIHRVSYTDATVRTASSASFVDSGTEFTLAAPTGSVIVGGWVQSQMEYDSSGCSTYMNLQFTGSNLGTWWCQQGYVNLNATSSYYDFSPFWAQTGTFTEYQLCGVRLASYGAYSTAPIPAGLKILDDDTVVKVRISSDTGDAMNIKNITITLVYTSGVIEDA